MVRKAQADIAVDPPPCGEPHMLKRARRYRNSAIAQRAEFSRARAREPSKPGGGNSGGNAAALGERLAHFRHHTMQECQVHDFQGGDDRPPGGRGDRTHRGHRDDLAARRLGGGDTGRGVLDDSAPYGVHAEAGGGREIRVGCGLVRGTSSPAIDSAKCRWPSVFSTRR
ncbi:hypothetical protein GCM10023238_10200 [Streptomyces heliomycini]